MGIYLQVLTNKFLTCKFKALCRLGYNMPADLASLNLGPVPFTLISVSILDSSVNPSLCYVCFEVNYNYPKLYSKVVLD